MNTHWAGTARELGQARSRSNISSEQLNVDLHRAQKQSRGCVLMALSRDLLYCMGGGESEGSLGFYLLTRFLLVESLAAHFHHKKVHFAGCLMSFRVSHFKTDGVFFKW